VLSFVAPFCDSANHLWAGRAPWRATGMYIPFKTTCLPSHHNLLFLPEHQNKAGSA